MSQHTDSDPTGEAIVETVIHLSPKECFRLLSNSRPGKERYDEIDRILKSQTYSFTTRYIISRIRELFPYWCENGTCPLPVREYIDVCKSYGIKSRRYAHSEPTKEMIS